MATLAISLANTTEAGATLRQLAAAIEKIALAIPDRPGSGAATVLTIDNAPSTGAASVQITAGPYPSSLILVG